MTETENRRPLKSRTTGWARGLARLLTAAGLSPNAISVMSTAFALLAAACILRAGRLPDGGPAVALWLCAAAGIQLRLLCNLMDGMVAVEGGKKTPAGEIFNDFPDRLADVAAIAATGYAAGSDLGVALGWGGACGALATAYVRLLGASIVGRHDFRGVMAKPQRMAVLTAACLATAFSGGDRTALWLALWAIALGTAATTAGRLRRLAKDLAGHQTG